MFGKGKREYDPHHIPLINKIGYAFGAMSDNLIMNAFGGLVMPVYNIALFVDPALLGWAIAVPRIFDAISDPIMGNISDNTRSRWGRRRRQSPPHHRACRRGRCHSSRARCPQNRNTGTAG